MLFQKGIMYKITPIILDSHLKKLLFSSFIWIYITIKAINIKNNIFNIINIAFFFILSNILFNKKIIGLTIIKIISCITISGSFIFLYVNILIISLLFFIKIKINVDISAEINIMQAIFLILIFLLLVFISFLFL